MAMPSGLFDFFNVNKDKTFRPRKRLFVPGTTRYNLMKCAQSSLHSGLDFRTAVQLPPGENLNDWIAVHVVDFFNRINLLYGTILEHCTEQSCPKMTGGSRYEYLWQDGERYKKPTRLAAPVYIALLMDWVENRINNQQYFPVDPVIPFPKDFHQLCSKILTRLFRVFVHVYIHHFDRLLKIGGEAHVNACLKHFYYFVKEYELVAMKELEPLVCLACVVSSFYRLSLKKMLIRKLTSSDSHTSSTRLEGAEQLR